MDIHAAYFPIQLVVLALIIIFSALSYKKPIIAVLITPLILPFYLVKLYFRPNSLSISSLFSPLYQEVPVVRPNFPSLDELVIPINLLETLLIMFLLLNIPLMILGFKQILSKLLGKYFIISVLFLLTSVLISTIYAINTRVALGAAKSWFFLPILTFFAILPLLKSQKFRQKFLYSLMIGGVILAFISVLFSLENFYTYDGRLSGIFLSPNHLAMALVPGILALVILLLTTDTGSYLPLTKYLYSQTILLLLPLLSIELFVLYKTYSYGTWIGLSTAFLIIIYFAGFKLHITKKTLPHYLIALLAIFLLLSTQLSNPKLTHIINGDYYSSLHSRTMIWQSTLAISKDYWLTGVGTDNFQQAYLDYAHNFKEPYIEWSAPQPHNIFLAFLTQLGVVGLFSFILIIALTIYRFTTYLPTEQAGDLRLTTKTDPLTLWALAYLAYLVIHGLVDTPYFKNDLSLLFWIAAAIIWSQKSATIEEIKE